MKYPKNGENNFNIVIIVEFRRSFFDVVNKCYLTSKCWFINPKKRYILGFPEDTPEEGVAGFLYKISTLALRWEFSKHYGHFADSIASASKALNIVFEITRFFAVSNMLFVIICKYAYICTHFFTTINKNIAKKPQINNFWRN